MSLVVLQGCHITIGHDGQAHDSMTILEPGEPSEHLDPDVPADPTDPTEPAEPTEPLGFGDIIDPVEIHENVDRFEDFLATGPGASAELPAIRIIDAEEGGGQPVSEYSSRDKIESPQRKSKLRFNSS